MRNLPEPPRTSSLTHEQAVDALQRWLYTCLGAGWDPINSCGNIWSHDDNLAAAAHGWMIMQAPSTPYVDLFSLKKNFTPAMLMDGIKRGATVDPLCAKAVITLMGQKLKFPDVKFMFERGDKH